MQLFLIVLAFAAFFAYALWSSRLGRPGGHYQLVTAQTVQVEVLGDDAQGEAFRGSVADLVAPAP